jgi:hypothetical protein
MKKPAGIIVIAHVVSAHEDFDHAAHSLLRLLRDTQRRHPGCPRALYLEIDGHRNAAGKFDRDMLELQTAFMRRFLLQFLVCAETPLGSLENERPQNNILPKELNILTLDPPHPDVRRKARNRRF